MFAWKIDAPLLAWNADVPWTDAIETAWFGDPDAHTTHVQWIGGACLP